MVGWVLLGVAEANFCALMLWCGAVNGSGRAGRGFREYNHCDTTRLFVELKRLSESLVTLSIDEI